MARDASSLEPIRRSVSVSWTPTAAYERFTADFGQWWPSYALSIGGKRVTNVVFECRVGGRIYEEHRDGTRYRWGTVLVLDPPRRVVFTYHATRADSDAQTVEVTFVAEKGGTRVELVASGWEKMGEEARRAYSGLKLSWQVALDVFARRSSGGLVFFNVMSAAMDWTGGRRSFMRNSLSKMTQD